MHKRLHVMQQNISCSQCSTYRPTIISVVIVNYNGLNWLEACLTSVLKQELSSDLVLQVVFVDNHSSDKSASFVRGRFPSVVVFEMDANYGFATSCEFGVSQASGDFIVLLNNDTVLPVGTLSDMVEELLERGLDVIAAIEVPYGGGDKAFVRTTIDMFGFPVHIKQDEWLSEGNSFFLSAVCLMVRKSTYLETGGLDTDFFMYFEDIDWFWRLRLMGYRFDYSKNCIVWHAGHGSTGGYELSYNRFLWRNTNLPKMLIKNLSIFNLIWVLPFMYVMYFVEYGILLLVGRRDLARSYLVALGLLRSSLGTVLKDRRAIQRSRIVGDSVVFAEMYPGLGKLRSFRHRSSRVKKRPHW